VVVGYFGITVMGIPKITSGKQEDLVFGIIILCADADYLRRNGCFWILCINRRIF
jgi:hypothetical protein